MSGSRIKQKGARRCFEKRREDPKGSQPYTYVDHMDIAARKWDWIKNTWLPKKGKGFHATHRASYGFSADSPSSSCAKKEHETVTVKPQEKFIDKRGAQNTEKKQRREKRKPETGWFQIKEDRNTNVYVTGLPPDVTKDEFIQLMSKCGIIMKHPQTEEYKIKLYKDAQGNLKGDGLCCYLKKESVSLALKLLDDDEIRGHRVHVEKAKFQLKGEYDASKKKKKGKDDRKKISLQKKKLNWPEKKTVTAQMRPEQVVIIRNMFHPKDFEKDPSALNEIKEDLQTECKKFGQLSKVLLFDRHPDGVASVTYKKPEEADVCIQALNGRWFGGRQLNVKVWDGVTDYQVEEIPREKEKGLKGLACFFEYSDIQRKIHASGASFAFGSMTLAAGKKF